MSTSNEMLNLLNQKGVLIKPKTGYWRASAKLFAKDLGQQDKDLPKNMFRLGKKILVKENALADFKLFEGRVNSFIDNITFQFLGGVGRFLPNAKLAFAVEELTRLEERFEKIVEDFVKDYGKHKVDGVKMWEEWIERNGFNDETKSLIISTIRGSFPTEDQIRKKCKFTWHMFHVQAPEEIQLGLIEAADAEQINEARQAAAQKAAQVIEDSVQGFISDAVTEMRQSVADLTEGILETMNTGKSAIHQKSLNKLANFIDHFSDLNFANDEDLARELQEARDTLLTTTAEDYRNDEFALSDLKSGLKKLHNKALEMVEADKQEIVERFGAIGARQLDLT